MQQANAEKVIGVGCVDVSPRERELIDQVLDSGLITTGPITERFEREFAFYHHRDYGLLLNSGTSALLVALGAMKELYGWEDGDEVILPALTFIASSNVIFQNHLKPVFVDVDPVTYNIDPSKIEAVITSRTRAIMPVHLFGLPCDMPKIAEIARSRQLRIIEDSCEAMGVNAFGRPVGSWGDAACFSTYAAHIITTGVGGLAITSDAELMKLMRSFANHGRDPEFLGFQSSVVLDPGSYMDSTHLMKTIERRFKFDRFGHSFRATQLEAALGLGQLERLPEILSVRRNHADTMTRALRNVPHIQLPTVPQGFDHAFMMYPIVLTNPDFDRNEACHYMEASAVETRSFFNILGQSHYRRIYGDHFETEFPVAKNLSARGFYFGCHQQLSHHDIHYIADVLRAGIDALGRIRA